MEKLKDWFFIALKVISKLRLPRPAAPAPAPKPTPIGVPENNESSIGIKKVALIVGHGPRDTGAVGNGTTELKYNTWVAEYIKKNVSNKVIEVFYRTSAGLDEVARRAAKSKPDLCIELHLNSTPGAIGCEILVLKGDYKSGVLARDLAKKFTDKFNKKLRRDKGVYWIDGQAGSDSLEAQKGIPLRILIEPFFIDTSSDFLAKELYAGFLTNYIQEL